MCVREESGNGVTGESGVSEPGRVCLRPPSVQAGLEAPAKMIERLAASRCPVCGLVAAPPSRWRPRHPVEMAHTSVAGAGDIISFTTLHSPPAGFRSPLHIALVELVGGARFICHGADTVALKIGHPLC